MATTEMRDISPSATRMRSAAPEGSPQGCGPSRAAGRAVAARFVPEALRSPQASHEDGAGARRYAIGGERGGRALTGAAIPDACRSAGSRAVTMRL